MKSELEEPLAAFAGGMKERRKIVQSGVEKLFKVKQQQTNAVNKVLWYYGTIYNTRWLYYNYRLEIGTNKTA